MAVKNKIGRSNYLYIHTYVLYSVLYINTLSNPRRRALACGVHNTKRRPAETKHTTKVEKSSGRMEIRIRAYLYELALNTYLCTYVLYSEYVCTYSRVPTCIHMSRSQTEQEAVYILYWYSIEEYPCAEAWPRPLGRRTLGS